jgi:hypothetical protein
VAGEIAGNRQRTDIAAKKKAAFFIEASFFGGLL